MAKTCKKRYWRNWNILDVPKDTVPPDFRKEVIKWAQDNRMPIVIRDGSRRITPDPEKVWAGSYEVFYKVHIEHKKDVTMFTLRWL